MRHTLLVTGGTGAVGAPLLAALSGLDDIETIYVLARRASEPTARGNIRPVQGDLTDPVHCGLAPEAAAELFSKVTAILHGAAHTRFDAPLDLARRVNTAGTQNLLALAARCRRLERFGFLSTCHVAGRRRGVILESELAHASGFVNAYEQSKLEAEQLARDAGIPVAIYRLSTLIGDSRSGAVHKPAAVHHAIRLCYGGLAPMLPGDPDSPVDLIASDYAVAAICELFCHRFAANQTFHICAGPDALRLEEFLDLTLAAFRRLRPAWRKRAIERPALVDLPTFELFARSVEQITHSALARSVRVMKHFAPQLAFPKRFDDTECARALAGGRAARPSLREFYPRIIQWLIEHRWNTAARGAPDAVAA